MGVEYGKAEILAILRFRKRGSKVHGRPMVTTFTCQRTREVKKKLLKSHSLERHVNVPLDFSTRCVNSIANISRP